MQVCSFCLQEEVQVHLDRATSDATGQKRKLGVSTLPGSDGLGFWALILVNRSPRGQGQCLRVPPFIIPRRPPPSHKYYSVRQSWFNLVGMIPQQHFPRYVLFRCSSLLGLLLEETFKYRSRHFCTNLSVLQFLFSSYLAWIDRKSPTSYLITRIIFLPQDLEQKKHCSICVTVIEHFKDVRVRCPSFIKQQIYISNNELL